MPHPKLSISIVHHQGLQMLRDCLASIFHNQPNCEFEVIVVDNVSTDGAIEMMEREFPQVHIIRNTERHGFGYNQNTGIEACQGEYVFIYNDDTVLHGDALNVLCEFLNQHPQVGLVGPRLLNPDGSLQMSCYKFPSPLRCVWENLLLSAAFPDSTIFGDYRAWLHDSIREVDFVIGAAMLVRRQVIEQVGLFDPLFFMYAEETDWQKRLKNAGWKIMFCPDAQITHYGGQSTETVKDRQFCEFQKSSLKLIGKHYGPIGMVVQRISMIIGSLLRLAMWSVISLLRPIRRTEAKQKIETWKKLLKWWLGLGPHQGLEPVDAVPVPGTSTTTKRR